MAGWEQKYRLEIQNQIMGNVVTRWGHGPSVSVLSFPISLAGVSFTPARWHSFTHRMVGLPLLPSFEPIHVSASTSLPVSQTTTLTRWDRVATAFLMVTLHPFLTPHKPMPFPTAISSKYASPSCPPARGIGILV